ncbi:MAG: GntR family transcriptional regulator [Gemmataceae bacterium]|nr:GntR family transcriptional regulator [Gemmataceae bacterium]
MTARGLIRGLREQIANQLRDDILSGRFEAGARLSETMLADRFGVSRGPIREALVQLTNEGMLVGKPNCGVVVASAAPDSIRELIVPIRRTVETYALRQFFDSITDDDFAAWEELLEQMKKACQKKDYNATVELDVAFHRSLLVRAGQPDLLAIWQTIVARIRMHFRQAHMKMKDPMRIYAEHRAIVDVFRKGDKEAAVRMLEVNIE